MRYQAVSFAPWAAGYQTRSGPARSCTGPSLPVYPAPLSCRIRQPYYTVAGIDGPIHFNITIPLWLFVAITIVLGFFMSLGKAAVYKHIPVYYPDHVGSVGGIVGLIGGLGGFVLPISFGIMNDLIGIWTSCFMLLTVLIAIALTWMHFTIIALENKKDPERREPRDLPELDNVLQVSKEYFRI